MPHGVKLTRPFAFLDREVTFDELMACSQQYAEYIGRYDAKPTDAVFGVNWYESVRFCRWLGGQMAVSESDQACPAPEWLDKETYPREPTPSANWAPNNWPVYSSRIGFRLPTEAEWEVASRSGSRNAYGFGSDVSFLTQFDWYTENSNRHVHPPKELRPNVRGLFDPHGNLSEWTHDWYNDFSAATVTDPRSDEGGSRRVRRGGSWYDNAALCRSASRGCYGPADHSSFSGFRLALSLSEEPSPAEPVDEAETKPVGGGK